MEPYEEEMLSDLLDISPDSLDALEQAQMDRLLMIYLRELYLKERG